MSAEDLAHEHYLRALELEAADRKAARAAYEACLARDCRHLEARINLGRVLHLEGFHEDAERIYRDTDELDATLFFNLAVLMGDIGRDAEATKLYRQAIVHDPGMADAHFNLSLLLERAGDGQNAYRHLLAYHRLTEEHKAPAEFAEDDTLGQIARAELDL
jgi:tetratricopeptide (TPR) repeat protein